MKSTYGGLTKRSNECSRYLIAKRNTRDADVLILRLRDGRTAMPVFGREEEAGMFVWLETTGESWRVVEISSGGLFALLRGSCVDVARIVHPFVADGVGKGPATVDREDFLRTLSGGWGLRGEGLGHESPPVVPVRGGEVFW